MPQSGLAPQDVQLGAQTEVPHGDGVLGVSLYFVLGVPDGDGVLGVWNVLVFT